MGGMVVDLDEVTEDRVNEDMQMFDIGARRRKI
jgi:hypothetical protein